MNTWEKENLEKIIAESKSRKEVLLKIGIRHSGDNFKTLSKYINLYNLSTEHFTKNYSTMVNIRDIKKMKMCDILVENSSYSRSSLKKRLYKEGYLERKCCLCGQDENWNGMKISLILDHINGVYNDNRIDNLRIVCPNCNAGLDTFAGKNLKNKKSVCECGNRKNRMSIKCMECSSFDRRIVERPSYDELIEMSKTMSNIEIGLKFGVSEASIRKWIKKYKN